MFTFILPALPLSLPLAVRIFRSPDALGGWPIAVAHANVAQNLTEWAAFTLVGAVFIGSVLHHWYSFLDR